MTILAKATGSTGNAVQDGATRGIIATALIALLVFVSGKADWLNDGDVATLSPIVTFIAFFIGGLYDRFLRPA